MSTNSFLENQNDIDNKPFSKKIIFNTRWERDINGIRKLELDAFRSLNSNVFNIYRDASLVGSPIDNTLTRTNITIFIARKRLIKLMDIWNRILNSGLMIKAKYSNGGDIDQTKIVGANLPHILAEYLFKAWDNNLSTGVGLIYPLNFSTGSIFNKISKFLIAYIKNYNYFILNGTNFPNYFALTSLWPGYIQIHNLINPAYNPTLQVNLNLMEELLDLYKDLISEQKVNAQPDLGFNFDNLTFLTEQGRANILKLDAYKSNYKTIAKIDIDEFNYLNPESKALVTKWIKTGSNLDKLYPQFATEIYRNEENEAWNYKNAMVKLNSFNENENFTEENIGVTAQELQKLKAKKYWVGSILDMEKPLYFNTQFINWENPDDRPYVMLYNGGTLIHIPDQLKELTNPDTFNTTGEAPDNQINLSAYFWKIGTSNISDPLYNPDTDIKLNLGSEPLQNLDKLDFLDNLNLYLKIN